LAKIQARKFRLQDAAFEGSTPARAKEKLRAAVPAGSTVVIYKTPNDFNAMIRANKPLAWIHDQMQSLSATATTRSVALHQP
jgi:hypothetical protein